MTVNIEKLSEYWMSKRMLFGILFYCHDIACTEGKGEIQFSFPNKGQKICYIIRHSTP